MATLRAARLAASNEGPPKLRVAIAAGAMPTAVAGMLSFFRPTPWNGVAIDELLFHLEQTRSAASAWRLKKTPSTVEITRSYNLSSRVMYVEVSDEAACSAGSFAINPFAR